MDHRRDGETAVLAKAGGRQLQSLRLQQWMDIYVVIMMGDGDGAGP